MAFPDPEQVAEWRRKASAGELTLDEQRKIIATIREGRVSAAIASSAAKKKASKSPIDGDSLLDELEGM